MCETNRVILCYALNNIFLKHVCNIHTHLSFLCRGGDCGVFVIKWIEHLAFGKDLKLVHPDRMEYFRRQIAFLLFASRKIPKPPDKE